MSHGKVLVSTPISDYVLVSGVSLDAAHSVVVNLLAKQASEPTFDGVDIKFVDSDGSTVDWDFAVVNWRST